MKLYDKSTNKTGEIIEKVNEDNQELYIVAFDNWETNGCERIPIDDKDIKLI